MAKIDGLPKPVFYSLVTHQTTHALYLALRVSLLSILAFEVPASRAAFLGKPRVNRKGKARSSCGKPVGKTRAVRGDAHGTRYCAGGANPKNTSSRFRNAGAPTFGGVRSTRLLRSPAEEARHAVGALTRGPRRQVLRHLVNEARARSQGSPDVEPLAFIRRPAGEKRAISRARWLRTAG
jgi:hypothetical protein